MRSPSFEITRLVLTAIGFLLLVGIAIKLIFRDSSGQAVQIIGWGIIALLVVGVVGMLRKRKR